MGFDWPGFLRTLRSPAYLDCSQEELARLVEVSVSSVSRWERGLARPQPRHLSALRRLATSMEYRMNDWPRIWEKYDGPSLDV